jgi:NAD(P)-dependent dehydrogenase (short-subunit alcohol dehydrogenase family)
VASAGSGRSPPWNGRPCSDADFASVKRAHEWSGRLDVVVNDAGYGHFGMVEEITEAEIPGRRRLLQARQRVLRQASRRFCEFEQIAASTGITPVTGPQFIVPAATWPG